MPPPPMPPFFRLLMPLFIFFGERRAAQQLAVTPPEAYAAFAAVAMLLRRHAVHDMLLRHDASRRLFTPCAIAMLSPPFFADVARCCRCLPHCRRPLMLLMFASAQRCCATPPSPPLQRHADAAGAMPPAQDADAVDACHVDSAPCRHFACHYAAFSRLLRCRHDITLMMPISL